MFQSLCWIPNSPSPPPLSVWIPETPSPPPPPRSPSHACYPWEPCGACDDCNSDQELCIPDTPEHDLSYAESIPESPEAQRPLDFTHPSVKLVPLGAIPCGPSLPPNVTVRICSTAELEAKIERYRQKRKIRSWTYRPRYPQRQAFAQSRPRHKGRFTKISKIQKLF